MNMEDIIENRDLVIAPFSALSVGPISEVIGARFVFLLSSIIGVVATSYTWRIMVVNKVDYDNKAALDEITMKINNVNGDQDGNDAK